MATQEDMYRESQKTTAKLEQVANLLEKQKAGGTFSESGMKKLEALQKQAEEANALQLKRENIERKLLAQSEKQYDAMLKQRKVAEEAKKEMQEIGEVLGEDAENNKEYQEAQKRYNKEQLKAQKLEQKRSLFQRFKDTKEEKGTGAAIGQLGKTAGEGAMKGLKGVFGFIKRFTGIFAAVLIPALVLFVNSPAFETAKKLIKDLIDYLDPGSPDGPFGPNGFIRMIIDKFGALNLAIAGVLGVLTLKFLGFSGLKVIFAGLKTVVLALKGAFVAGLTALSSFLGIAVAPLVAIIAAIAAVGYALYDTFVEVKKKFDEGASVGELIQTAIVNFVGAFGKILDFIKDLVADVLEFFGFEDLAKTFREFSFEKIIEDALNSVIDFFTNMVDKVVSGIRGMVDDIFGFFTGLFDIDFMEVIKKIPGAGTVLKLIDKAASVGESVKSLFGFGDDDKGAESEAPGKATAAASARTGPDFKGGRKVGIAERAMMRSGMDLGDADLASDERTVREKIRDKRRLERGEGAGREQLIQIRRARRAVQKEEAIAEGAGVPPAVIDGKTINVNEGPKTENNVSTQPSMRPSGSTGQLAMGGGSMTGGAYL